MLHASVTLKGAIDKGTAGKSCVVLVADNFTISGNGGILKTDIGQCPQAGLTIPKVTLRRVGVGPIINGKHPAGTTALVQIGRRGRGPPTPTPAPPRPPAA